MKPIRWGIIGCGGIASKFANSIKVVDTGELVACASRAPGRAEQFANSHRVPRAYDRYEALVASSEVDAVYIATTHNFHLENMLLALEAGKAVLCEKPLAVSAEEAKEAVALARQKGLFLMEGMWTRFLPAMRRVRSWLDEGAIGEPRSLRADFCIHKDRDPENRLFNPDLAGGALLDAGVYPISMASFVMGAQPEKVAALAHIGDTGVDELTGAVFKYAGGRLALLSCAVSSGSANRLEIVGSKGRIEVPSLFIRATEAILHPNNGDPIREKRPYKPMEGFRYEIEAANEAIGAGRAEHPIMPLEESVAVMETMDRVRERIRGE